MARTRTLLLMRTEVYERADVDSNYVGTAEINRLLNAKLAGLYRLLVKVNKDFYLSSTTISVVASTDTYSYPADFWRVMGVDLLDGGDWLPMRRFNFAERNMFQDSTEPRSTRYRAIGGTLRLSPVPAWSGTVRMWYIPAPEILVNDADTWDGFAGYEDLAVIDSAIALRAKQEEDVSWLIEERKGLIADIFSSASTRDDAEPDRIRDYESEGYISDYRSGTW